MKILLVAATEGEISLLKGIISTIHNLEFLVTGPGMVATTYELSKHLSLNKFDLAINCGIAGSFDRSIVVGEVVNVTEDIFSEPGAEDGEEFLNLSAIGLEGIDTFKNSFVLNSDTLNRLKKVRGITVNTVHGNDSSISKIIKRHQPQIESMEGAAFFFVCEKENIPSLQLRAISNFIERRNKDNWNIPLALENLKKNVVKIIEEI